MSTNACQYQSNSIKSAEISIAHEPDDGVDSTHGSILDDQMSVGKELEFLHRSLHRQQ